MFKLFQNFSKTRAFETAFKEAINLEKTDSAKALEALTKLYSERPNNVYLRHELIMLRQSMSLPMELPETTKSSVRGNSH